LPLPQQTNAAFPHDVLVRIFSLLPRGVLAVTPGRVCRPWAAAKQQAWEATKPPAGETVAGISLSFGDDGQQFFELPRWYVRGVYGQVSFLAQQCILLSACYHGQLDVVQDVHAMDRGRGRGRSLAASAFACDVAAKGGSVDVVRWLRQRGYPAGASTCYAAADAGHLPMLQFLRQEGVDWNADTCSAAAYRGHMHVLRWARENGPCPWTAETFSAAAKGGHHSVLAYLRQNGWCAAIIEKGGGCKGERGGVGGKRQSNNNNTLTDKCHPPSPPPSHTNTARGTWKRAKRPPRRAGCAFCAGRSKTARRWTQQSAARPPLLGTWTP
jgi:hypothetical protein